MFSSFSMSSIYILFLFNTSNSFLFICPLILLFTTQLLHILHEVAQHPLDLHFIKRWVVQRYRPYITFGPTVRSDSLNWEVIGSSLIKRYRWYKCMNLMLKCYTMLWNIRLKECIKCIQLKVEWERFRDKDREASRLSQD